MNDKSRFRVTPQVMFGIGVILIGVILTLDNLDIVCADDIFLYWPALLILFGLGITVQGTGSPGKGIGLIIAALGVLLLLDNLRVIDFSIWDYWPLLLILLGFSLVRGGYRRRRGSMPGEGENASSYINAFALLGGHETSGKSDDFRGGSLTAIMGSCEVDLRESSIRSDAAVLDVFAFWGAIELKIPEQWSVMMKGFPILGGFADKTRRSTRATQKQLIIRGYAIMGGIEIKN